jgi:hypothetical protein
MSADHRPIEVQQWLVERGHSKAEIDKIFDRLREFDSKITHDALFDDLASGNIDMEALIQEALKGGPGK